jgi:hypothetical protein
MVSSANVDTITDFKKNLIWTFNGELLRPLVCRHNPPITTTAHGGT